MVSFFDTKTYRTYKFLKDRLEILNTEKNYRKFMAWRILCYRLADRKYNNIGWVNGKYLWDKTDAIQSLKKNIGHPQLFYGSGKLSVKIKDKVINFTLEELNKIKLHDFHKILKLKSCFGGHVV